MTMSVRLPAPPPPTGPSAGPGANAAAAAGREDDGPAPNGAGPTDSFAALIEAALGEVASPLEPLPAPGTRAPQPPAPVAADDATASDGTAGLPDTAVPMSLPAPLPATIVGAGPSTDDGPVGVTTALPATAGEAPRPVSSPPTATLTTGPAASAQVPGPESGPDSGHGSGSNSGPGLAPASDPGLPTIAAGADPTVGGPEFVGTADGTAPVTGPTAGASAPVPPVSRGEAAAAVTGQVFPEVTRLASGADGVHRVTLQLEPGALGEVRVVLTVRGGEVHVRLAGGEEAVAALQSTTHELHRMLERAGVQAGRIDVRDLAGSPVTTAREASSTGTEQQVGAGHRDDGGHPQHERSQGWNQARAWATDTDLHHPWTGGGRIATDGADQTARGATRPGAGRPFDPVRAAGVDLTM